MSWIVAMGGESARRGQTTGAVPKRRAGIAARGRGDNVETPHGPLSVIAVTPSTKGDVGDT